MTCYRSCCHEKLIYSHAFARWQHRFIVVMHIQYCCMYSVSRKSPPAVFWHFFPNGWEFLISYTHLLHVHIYARLQQIFTARCTLVQSAVLRSHVVCLSVRLSVTLVNCDYIGWNSSKIISPLVCLGCCSLFATPTWRVCSKGNTPKFSPE